MKFSFRIFKTGIGLYFATVPQVPGGYKEMADRLQDLKVRFPDKEGFDVSMMLHSGSDEGIYVKVEGTGESLKITI